MGGSSASWSKRAGNLCGVCYRVNQSRRGWRLPRSKTGLIGVCALAALDRHGSLDGPIDAPAASAPPSRPPPAVLLRLGRAGLHLPGGLRAPGPGGGRAVGLRRADDRGVRLVAHRDGGRGVAGRRAGGLRLADARTGPRSPRRAAHPLPGRAGHGLRDHGALAHPVAPGVLPAVLLRAHGLGRAVRSRPLWRVEQLVRGAPRAAPPRSPPWPRCRAWWRCRSSPSSPCAMAAGAAAGWRSAPPC